MGERDRKRLAAAGIVSVVGLLALGIAGCGESNNPASDAKTYVRTISTDTAQVQADEIKVGLDILHNDVTGLAQDAQTAHDDFVNVKTDIRGAGTSVADNTRLGNAEYQMDNAINELKNGMGAIVAFTENPNAGTLGAANSKLDQGITDWDQAATVIWTMAGQSNAIPTLSGSTVPSTDANAATTSATTCPPGMATNQNGELVYGSQGAYGPECEQIAAGILAKNAQVQAQAEDNACGGRGPGAPGCGQSSSTNAPPPQSHGFVRCPNVTLQSGGQAKVAIVAGPATCSQTAKVISDALASPLAIKAARNATGGMWSWDVDDYTCTSGGDGTSSTCVGGSSGVQASKIVAITPTPGGWWPDPTP
jgi:hypothetical protein